MRAALLLGLTVFLAACGPRAAPSPPANAPIDEAFAPSAYRYERAPAPFRRATTVRLFVRTAYREVNGETQPVYLEPQGRRFTAAQRSAFEATIRRRVLVRAGSEFACFVPHHFFRFYDAQNRQIGEIAVCFCCFGVGVEPATAAEGSDFDVSVDYDQARAFVQSLGLPTDIECD